MISILENTLNSIGYEISGTNSIGYEISGTKMEKIINSKLNLKKPNCMKKITDLTEFLKLLKSISEEAAKTSDKRKFYKTYDFSQIEVEEELIYFFQKYINPSDLPYFGIDENLIYESNFEVFILGI